MPTLRNFEEMWLAYPNPGQSSSAAKATIGGRVDADWIKNTCVVRVSRALNYSDQPIPQSSNDEIVTVTGADNLNYALRVREFSKYMDRVYGPATLHHEYEGGQGGAVPPSFVGREGIIMFDVDGWSDATGHFDLWNGGRCRHAAYFNRASSVSLWEADGVAPPRLGGSVGRGGRNTDADTRTVQQLLIDRGEQPGRVDGDCGPRTIAAIESFQRGFLSRPDGRVDVDGRTWRELNEL